MVKKKDVPKGATLLPAVWQMKRKRDITTREIKNHKARLNIDGSRMVKYRDYNLTYAPVANWATIKLLLALTLIHDWHTVQLDYVLAFTQAPVERELYMKIPRDLKWRTERMVITASNWKRTPMVRNKLAGYGIST